MAVGAITHNGRPANSKAGQTPSSNVAQNAIWSINWRVGVGCTEDRRTEVGCAEGERAEGGECMAASFGMAAILLRAGALSVTASG